MSPNLISALTLGVLVHAASPSGQKAVDRPVPFAVLNRGYRLVQETHPETLPTGHGGLFLIENGKRSEVDSMAKLLNKVSIHSGEDALAFVRLKTRLDLLGAWSVAALEVEVSKGDKGAGLDREAERFIQDGYAAQVRGEMLKRLNLASASAQRVGDGYLVRRYVLERTDRKSDRVFFYLERVGPKGRYERIGHRLVTNSLVRSIRWYIPTEE